MSTSPASNPTRSPQTAAWLGPSLVYIGFIGIAQVLAKVALEDMAWQQLVLWLAIAYTTFSVVLLVGFGVRLKAVPAARWGALSGVFVVAIFVALSVALEQGDVSEVVPVAASYPVFTAVLAVIVLRERLTARRMFGTAVIVGGVIAITI